MAKPTNFSGARAYFTTHPVAAEIENVVAEDSKPYALGTVITALDTGEAYQVSYQNPDGTFQAILIDYQF